MRKFTTTGLSIISTVALTLGAGMVANAEPIESQTGSTELLESLTPSVWAEVDALAKINPYVIEGVLDYSGAKADPGINQVILDEYANGLREARQAQEDQRTGTVNRTPMGLSARAMASCAGRSGMESGVPPALLLDSCQAMIISGLLAMGAGVATLAAALTAATAVGPIIAGTIAGYLSIYSGLYTICGSWGRGIKIFITPLTPCWSQWL